MMETRIIAEATLFVHALLLGAFLAVVNEVLAFFRRLWHHNTVAVAMEDVFFWMLTGILLVAMVYRENDGKFRGFIFLGLGAGVLVEYICRIIISKIFKSRKDTSEDIYRK